MTTSTRPARLTRLAAIGAALALAAGALLAAPPTQAADYPPAIPVAPQGTGTLWVNDQLYPVTITPLPTGTGVKVTGPGFTATLQGLTTNGSPGEVAIVRGVPLLILESNGAARTGGEGFQAFSVVNLVITPNVETLVVNPFVPNTSINTSIRGATKAGSIKFGSTTTDAKGAFKTTTPLPPGLAPGDYTITMAGTGPTGETIYLNVGVRVTGPKTAKATTKVFFNVGWSAITPSAEADLDALIRRVPKTAKDVQVKVTGFVQPTSFSGNDQTLSTARARNVADYLKAGGLKGVYTVSGAGKAKQTGAAARRVEVVVTYTK